MASGCTPDQWCIILTVLIRARQSKQLKVIKHFTHIIMDSYITLQYMAFSFFSGKFIMQSKTHLVRDLCYFRY